MKLVIHDLEEKNFRKIKLNLDESVKVISDDGTIHNCVGCFGCWVKTPGECVIQDKYSDMGELLSKCDTVNIISKCYYGGYSPFVKNVLDRSISYVHPYFEIRNGDMHHKSRYNNRFKLQVTFYGEDITENEKQTAGKLVKANSINLNCNDCGVSFVQNIEEMEGLSI